MSSSSDFLTVDEACELLGVKKATLYSYVSRGLVKSYKQGIRRQRLYQRAELEALLTVRPGEAEPLETAEPEAEAETASGLPRADEWVSDR